MGEDDRPDRVATVPTVRRAAEDAENEGPGSTCAWISVDSSREVEAAVYGFYVAASAAPEARERFRSTRREVADTLVIEPVTDLGNDASFVVSTEPRYTGTPSLPYLAVRLGDRVGAADAALGRLAPDD